MRRLRDPLILLAVAGTLSLASACGPCDASRLDARADPVVALVASLPSTTIATTTTREGLGHTVARASRSRPAVRALPTAGPTASIDAAFWRRLANCESSDGRSGTFLGYFQFSRDTARKIGWYDGASYDAQVAMAQRWLVMIGGPARGGTRSGWPHCWWVALRG